MGPKVRGPTGSSRNQSAVELMEGAGPQHAWVTMTRVLGPVISCCDALVRGEDFTKETDSFQGPPLGNYEDSINLAWCREQCSSQHRGAEL